MVNASSLHREEYPVIYIKDITMDGTVLMMRVFYLIVRFGRWRMMVKS